MPLRLPSRHPRSLAWRWLRSRGVLSTGKKSMFTASVNVSRVAGLQFSSFRLCCICQLLFEVADFLQCAGQLVCYGRLRFCFCNHGVDLSSDNLLLTTECSINRSRKLAKFLTSFLQQLLQASHIQRTLILKMRPVESPMRRSTRRPAPRPAWRQRASRAGSCPARPRWTRSARSSASRRIWQCRA